MKIVRNQITYLFGAGASFNAIPCVDGVPYRLKDLSIYFHKVLDSFKNKAFEKGLKVLNDFDRKNAKSDYLIADGLNFILRHLPVFIQDIEWLIEESKNHQTIDTLAKRFSLTDDDYSLNRLKKVLIIYFFFEQNIYFESNARKEDYEHKHEIFLDKRFDNLIASIANKVNEGIELNKNVKFITWNYDLQIEYALKNYFSKENQTVNFIKDFNQIFPNRNNLLDQKSVDLTKFAALKLNGSAYLDVITNVTDTSNIYDKRYIIKEIKPLDIIYEFIKYSEDSFKRNVYLDSLIFAWENKNYEQNQAVNDAIQVMKHTKILVIIGYSFPFFNSSVDKLLLKDCNPTEIIIEDLYPDLICQRLKTLEPKFGQSIYENKITFRKPSGTFFIHPET